MKQNNKVGVLAEMRGKKAIVQFGAIPLTVEWKDLKTVRERPADAGENAAET
jgi:dsDNA-specific endonuclease/ATPase MutS2